MSKWKKYRNGNYSVFIDLEEGTKIRVLDEGETEYKPVFPEGCDILISNHCERGCPYCYAGCSPDGVEPPIPRLDFEPYTEIAININNFPLHQELKEFLAYQSMRNVIVNATVNQDEAIQYPDLLDALQYLEYIKGLGISYTGEHEKLPCIMSDGPNRILHVIAGLFSEKDHEYLQTFDIPPKLLILGYKHKHRGRSYIAGHLKEINANTQWLKHNLQEVIQSYPVVSFDNRALEDLDVGKVLGQEVYDSHYMGDEGQFTFAIDLVKGAYASSSQAYDTGYRPMGNLTPTQMFQEVQHGLV